MSLDYVDGEDTSGSFKLGSPSILWGILGRHTSLRLDVAFAFITVNLLLVAACLIALRQNVALRRDVASDVALLTPRNGLGLPPLSGVDWTGAQQTIAYGQDSLPTLIYSFSQECPYCQANWETMRPLQALAPRSLRIVYIDTIGDQLDQDYVQSKGIGQSVLLVSLSQNSDFVYSARLMPQILLVNTAGRVQWAHIGELSHGDVSKVLSFIKPDHI